MNIKLGISLYSYTREFINGDLSFADCIRQCAELGVTGYEIVGAQMLPSYPYVSQAFLKEINRLSDLYGVYPVTYGANTDRGMRHDRDLNDQELIATTIRDIKTAHQLGCGLMRAQYLLSPENLVRVARYAEEYDVKVGIEIHNPETPTSPKMLEYRQAIIASGSKYIGFVPDFGCFADRPNIDAYEGALSRGADKAMLDYAVQLRYDNVPMTQAELDLQSKNADPEVMKSFYMNYGFLTFYKEPDLAGLKEIMPYSFYFHGKFHHILDDGTERSIPYEKILPVIAEANFDGYIVSEYENHVSGLAPEMVKKHIAMERRILGL